MSETQYGGNRDGSSSSTFGSATPPSLRAREHEAVLLARAAYRKFHVECFWTFEADMDITLTKVDWVIERLLRHGRGEAWKAAERIQELLAR